MWAHIKNKTTRFLNNRQGNLTLMTAITLPVMLAITGAAVDYRNLSNNHGDLQRAVDIAVLAAGGAVNPDDPASSTAMITDIANNQLNSQLGDLELASTPVVIHDVTNGRISMNAEAKVENFFGGILSQTATNISVQSEAVYDFALDTQEIETSTGAPGEDFRHTSVMFLLDASGSMGATYGGDIANEDGRYDGFSRIRRRDVLRVEVGSVFDEFDRFQDLNPEAEEKIRTGVLAFNRGRFDRRSNDLQAGWTETRDNADNTRTSNFTLPASTFEEAMDQLNTDGPTLENNARKIIVFMGDGELDDHARARIFYSDPESEVLARLCTEAKNDGIEVYVSTLDLNEESVVDIYRQCASPNGSINGYTQQQADIDASCQANRNSQGRETCTRDKSEYFLQTESAEQLRDFFQLTPITIASTPPETVTVAEEERKIFIARLVR